MSAGQLQLQLHRLAYGLADQLIVSGTPLTYDGGRLRPAEAAQLAMPSLLCLADELSRRLGTGDLGYDFVLLDHPNPVFPMHAAERSPKRFMAIAPYFVESFDLHTARAAFDVAYVFAAAARVLDPAFDLHVHTTYQIGDRKSPAVLPVSSAAAALTR